MRPSSRRVKVKRQPKQTIYINAEQAEKPGWEKKAILETVESGKQSSLSAKKSATFTFLGFIAASIIGVLTAYVALQGLLVSDESLKLALSQSLRDAAHRRQDSLNDFSKEARQDSQFRAQMGLIAKQAEQMEKQSELLKEGLGKEPPYLIPSLSPELQPNGDLWSPKYNLEVSYSLGFINLGYRIGNLLWHRMYEVERSGEVRVLVDSRNEFDPVIEIRPENSIASDQSKIMYRKNLIGYYSPYIINDPRFGLVSKQYRRINPEQVPRIEFKRGYRVDFEYQDLFTKTPHRSKVHYMLVINAETKKAEFFRMKMNDVALADSLISGYQRRIKEGNKCVYPSFTPIRDSTSNKFLFKPYKVYIPEVGHWYTLED